MKIVDVLCSEGRTGFYFDDQKAIKKGAKHDGFFYVGEPATTGFTAIRQAGEAISVMFILEDGQVAYGDCAAVQYSGAGGRDPLFLAKDFIPVIENDIKPLFVGKQITTFREMAKEFEEHKIAGKRMHTALRYGVSQAILDAVAKARHITMAEVIVDEYKINRKIQRIPIFTQSGDDRYDNADKMIIKQADVLPHGLFNNVEEKTGKNGEKLLEYVKWLKNRIETKRPCPNYKPILHIDVYGTIGDFTNNDVEKMTAYLKTLEEAAKPFKLRIEGPMDMGDRESQMKCLAALTASLDKNNIKVELVADEWCNTIEDIKYFVDNKAGHMIQVKTPDLGGIQNTVEAILYCKENGVGAYCGGTCNETNRSAEVITNCSVAAGASQQLAKPGMGVDEGYMLVNNEMNRIVALANRKK
ncbi:MAG: methylaspartate ammonia-lyase [Treponemataceae bacterium]